jgi:hypothetical protein
MKEEPFINKIKDGLDKANPATWGKELLEKIKDIFKKIEKTITGLLDNIVNKIKEFVENIPKELKNKVWLPIYNKTIKPVVNAFKSAISWIKLCCIICSCLLILSSSIALGIPQTIFHIAKNIHLRTGTNGLNNNMSNTPMSDNMSDNMSNNTMNNMNVNSPINDSMVMFNGMPSSTSSNNNIKFNLPDFSSNEYIRKRM